MYENQFIRFFDTEEEAQNSHVGHVVKGSGITIYTNDKSYFQTRLFVNGVVALDCEMDDGVCIIPASELASLNLKDGDVLQVMERGDIHSNGIIYHETSKGLSRLQYRCYEDAFGFPFASGYRAEAWVPVNIKAPEYAQTDETYTKLDGSVVTLYSQARKEWDGETEYLTEDWHDKFMIALMCDEVLIDGRRVVKSGQYSVDWGNYDMLCDGTKAAKATFKVQANMVSRNSNN